MDLSAVVISIVPEQAAQAIDELEAIEQVEVHLQNSDPAGGRLMTTVACVDAAASEELLKRLRTLPGVLDAALVIHVPGSAT